MKSIDKFNIGLIIICTIIYIILCINTKYKSIIYNDDTSKQSSVKFSSADYRMLYFTTVYGFIYGAIVISFQQRYLTKKISSLWIWVCILFISILLVFSAFYSQIYTDNNPDSFMSKFSYSIIPILPSLVILAESSISEVLEHGFVIQRDYSSYGGNTSEYWELSD
jgi:hypothetical protein